ncbi:class I adenylate-forming enzyme family protein [Sphingomonas jatrophae]|uniref:Acyl-CoA synthetase (AMP-forming)/AMP-acid ligase II n=1 Tax=Sphingomonas jatrophae TaxID=1166337 RepID=A0A1I6KF91_9SPHN|nr:class I adenylate-forming enzyme family protein [Sphingomonas jatrophae]SFR89912.1 Acyl-CoA synthetase (AMP-forming)/AMP-acid ligase II [Sphingomonas jatrophae]
MQDAFAALTAPGAEYEIVEDTDGTRLFRTAPASLGAIYAESAARFGPREFLVFEDQRYTFAQFYAAAEAMRRRIAPRRGERIAIAMRNRPEWLIAFVAITAGGASAVLVNSRGTPADLAAAVEDAGCRLVVADARRAQALATCPVDLIDVDDGVATGGSEPLQIADIDPMDEAAVIFTTGTSGRAKGAMHSHRGVVAALMNIAFSRASAMHDATRHLPREVLAGLAAMQPSVLTPYPLFHVAGLNSDFLTFLRTGGKMVLMGRWDAAEALALIERERVMATSGSPAMLWDLLRAHDGSRDLSSLQGLGVGGQALPPRLFDDVRAMFPNAGFGCGFGQTEVGGPVSSASLRLLVEKPGCSGRPVPAIDLRIADQAGAPLPARKAGEILVRGACAATGYCNLPEETAETFRDGWVHTGDIGYLDQDGVLFVIDRRRSILISGGENISLTEIEHAAQADPNVIDAAAIAVADERMGEVPVLAVTPRDGVLDEASLAARLAERLAAYKLPRRIVAVAAIPRNHMDKIDRAALRAMVPPGIN